MRSGGLAYAVASHLVCELDPVKAKGLLGVEPLRGIGILIEVVPNVVEALRKRA